MRCAECLSGQRRGDMTQTVLPIFSPAGSRVRVPAPGGGYNVTWTVGEARTVDGEIVIRCAREGEVKVQDVKVV